MSHQPQLNKPFPCTSCGKCCQSIKNSSQTRHLDRGDGTCRHFVDETLLCSIYETRPLECRVEEYYQKHLSQTISWDDFIEVNVSICRKLQS